MHPSRPSAVLCIQTAVLLAGLMVFASSTAAQSSAATPNSTLERIQESALGSDFGYQQARYLCNKIGPRMAGSPEAAAAVEWIAGEFKKLGLQVSREATAVPHWVRGQETAALVSYPGMMQNGSQKVVITALGGSVPTPAVGLTAPVVVINDFAELQKLGKAVTGKIVLFNVKFDQNMAEVGYSHDAYLQVVRYRVMGASKAADLGAVASLLRSIGPGGHRLAHTGSVRYFSDKKIPAGAISVEDADLIADLAAEGPVTMHLVLTPQVFPDTQSYNVIADLKGSQHPERIVLVTAHLDSWDLGTGALDNGVGIGAILQVAQVLHELNLKPANTIRFIAWMNEENGGSGYTTYAEEHSAELPSHVAEIEIDNGTLHPIGYITYGTEKLKDSLKSVTPLLERMGSGVVRQSPTPMSGLADSLPSLGLLVDDRHYYDLHHTAADTFDKVSLKGSQEDSAVMALLAWAAANSDAAP